jgi:cysteine desulfurase/selenocysteine lyase
MTPFDLDRARRDTPGCDYVLHFNNAGAALMPHPVLDALIGHLEFEASVGGYEAADRAQEAIEHTYEAAATLLGCSRQEIAIVENATRAWDMVFYAIPFQPGDRILTSVAEYGSNYIAFLQIAQRTGASVEVIPNDEYGRVSVEALRLMMDEHVKLIAITHVPTNGGLVNPASEIGDIARQADVLYLLDACQSVGQMPVDVGTIGCDMLSATGRKYLRGPRGIGFLYIRNDLIQRFDPPFLDLHAATWTAHDRYEVRADARRFENWESNVAGKIGLGVAIDYAMEWGVEKTWERIAKLADLLRSQLESIPEITVHDLGLDKCGIISFSVKDKDPYDIRRALLERNINVSVSKVESTRLDMEARGLESLIRASVHYYNSEEEVDRFCDLLTSLIR